MSKRFLKKDFKPYLKSVTALLLKAYPNAYEHCGEWIVKESHNISYKIQFIDHFIAIQIYYLGSEGTFRMHSDLNDYFEDLRSANYIHASEEKKQEHAAAQDIGINYKWNIQGSVSYKAMKDEFIRKLVHMSEFPEIFHKWLVKNKRVQ